MTNLIKIKGSGGGKSGGSDTYEADDNLFSRQSITYIDALAEGPIKGLVYADASILVNETRLRDVSLATGNISSVPNFKNFNITSKNGDPSQSIDGDWFAEFPAASVIVDAGSSLLKSGEAQYFTISSSNFSKDETDYIKVTLFTNSMQRIQKTGDNKGDITPTEVYFNISLRYVKSDGSIATKLLMSTGFSGKVTSKYSHTFGFNIEEIKASEGVTDWALKIEKLSSSPTSNDNVAIYNDVYVETIEANISDKLEYPHTAYIAGIIDAEQFSSVPTRGYEIDGKIISIPTNSVPCDYNGRKVVVADSSGFSVGETLSNTVTLDSLSIPAVSDDSEPYKGTATVTSAHNIIIGSTFDVTISNVTGTGSAFVNTSFVATATTATEF